MTLDSLIDDRLRRPRRRGRLRTGGTIAGSGDYSCSFTDRSSAATSAAPTTPTPSPPPSADDDGNSDTATDTERSSFRDVLPDITVTKTADDDLGAGDRRLVNFTVT